MPKERRMRSANHSVKRTGGLLSPLSSDEEHHHIVQVHARTLDIVRLHDQTMTTEANSCGRSSTDCVDTHAQTDVKVFCTPFFPPLSLNYRCDRQTHTQRFVTVPPFSIASLLLVQFMMIRFFSFLLLLLLLLLL